MFRPPMRLEKWIAYDAAIGADLLALAADADADADTPDEAAGFTFVTGEVEGDVDSEKPDTPVPNENGNYKITDFDGDREINATINIDFTSNIKLSSNLPFLGKLGDNIYTVNTGSGDSASGWGDIWFEISNPTGDFGFLAWNEALYGSTGAGSSDLSNFIDKLDGWPGGQYSSDYYKNDIVFLDNGVLRLYSLQNLDSPDEAFYEPVKKPGTEEPFEIALTDFDDKLSIFLKNFDPRDTATSKLLDAIFRSTTYEGSASNPKPEVSVYYDADPDSGDDKPPPEPPSPPDPPGGGDEPIDDEPIGDNPIDDNPIDGKPDPDPNPGDEVLPPIVPPSPPGDSGGGESGDSESGGDGESGEAGEGESGDSGDAADALGGDDMAVVFQDEGSGETTENSDEEANAEGEANAAAEQAREAGARDGTPETAAAAEQLELSRDMEFLLTAVRNEKEVLLGHIGRLQSEYLFRDPVEYGELRGYLRRLFDLGREEESTVNRIISAMNREMDVFRATAPGRRDGMLAESVRELIASAERHSGEMGAYSHAVEAVAALLAAKREEGLPPPSDAEASALFAAEYESALSAWQASADRLDPMGREFTAMRRVAES